MSKKIIDNMTTEKNEEIEMEIQEPKSLKPPVVVDDEIEVEIISRGKKGDGVARYKDFVVFVPNANVGEKVKVIVEKVFKNFCMSRKIITE